MDHVDDCAEGYDLSYTVDAHGVIESVGGRWDEFAEANGGGATRAAVVGRPLLQFVAGDATCMFVDAMVLGVRRLNRTFVRPYRCDSGNVRRYMEMQVAPGTDGRVVVSHRLVRSEAMKAAVQLRLQRTASGPAIKRCSLCNRVRVGEAWCELDDAILDGRLRGRQELRVFHGLCEECRDRVGAVP